MLQKKICALKKEVRSSTDRYNNVSGPCAGISSIVEGLSCYRNNGGLLFFFLTEGFSLETLHVPII